LSVGAILGGSCGSSTPTSATIDDVVISGFLA
jgi:hypothetical protein